MHIESEIAIKADSTNTTAETKYKREDKTVKWLYWIELIKWQFTIGYQHLYKMPSHVALLPLHADSDFE